MKDTWTLNQCVSTLMEVFLNHKRINVCGHTVKMVFMNQKRINICENTVKWHHYSLLTYIYSLLIEENLRKCFEMYQLSFYVPSIWRSLHFGKSLFYSYFCLNIYTYEIKFPRCCKY